MKKAFPYILLALLTIAAISIRRCNNTKPNKPVTPVNPKTVTNDKNEDRKRFNRNVAEIFFSKHARCRMDCRHITQKEVREILAKGEINYNKSDLNATEGPKYAVEGITSDRQKVRIIFAPHDQHMTVVTVIDLGNEWSCPSCN